MRFSVILCSAYFGWAFAALPSGIPNPSNCAGVNGLSPQCRPVEAPHRREVFYVGGHVELDVQTKQHVVVDKMYVEKLTPFAYANRHYPLVFFHGGGFSGAAWLQTPDNRRGFMSYFLDMGYRIYLLDQTSAGRSTQPNLATYPIQGIQSVEGILRGFTRMEDYNDYPQAKLHTQWPGTGRIGDPTFDAISGLSLPTTTNSQAQDTSMRHAGCALLSIIGKSFLISHSIGAAYPILLSDECPDLIAGNVNLEPTTIPFETIIGPPASPGGGRIPTRKWGLANTPLTYDPAPASPEDLKPVRVGQDTPGHRSCLQQSYPPRRLPKINRVPYVALTGEASQHATYDHCIVNYLRQAGGKPDWIKLWEIGIKGNGHFGYLEENRDQIAGVVERWMLNQERILGHQPQNFNLTSTA